MSGTHSCLASCGDKNQIRGDTKQLCADRRTGITASTLGRGAEANSRSPGHLNGGHFWAARNSREQAVQC